MADLRTSLLRRVLTVAALALGLGAAPVAQAASRARASAREVALAREYVFAACLIEKYRGSPLAAEAEVWAQGLVERGSIPAASYLALAQIARSDAPEPLGSKSGMLMLMDSCMRLYNSAGVKEKITRLLRERR